MTGVVTVLAAGRSVLAVCDVHHRAYNMNIRIGIGLAIFFCRRGEGVVGKPGE
jgi:hypothetical protein